MNNQKQEDYLKDWRGLEEYAEWMLPLIGRMYRGSNINCNGNSPGST